MSSNRSSAAPLLPGVLVRWLSTLVLAFMLTGCAGLPFLGKPLAPAAAPATEPGAAATASTAARPVAMPSAAPGAAPTQVPAPGLARTAPRAGETPDAVPRIERISTTLPNLPYHVRGQDYQPHNADVPMTDVGIASWYGEPFHGRHTANGEVYDMHQMTAAHKTMPLPSYAVVRNRQNGKQVVVRVNDRGPFKDGRVIDLSLAAARKLGFTGLADVEVRRLTHDDIRTGAWRRPEQRLAGLGEPK
jgi:rare lipoprotein A